MHCSKGRGRSGRDRVVFAMIFVTPHSGQSSGADTVSSIADAPEALPVGSAVGSFVLSGVASRDEFVICYHATSSASDTQVTIEEYAPAQIARRVGDGVLAPVEADLEELLADGQRAFLHEAEQFSRLSHPSLLRIGPTWRVRGTAYRLRIGGEGRPLAAALDDLATRPDEPWLRRWMAPLLDALEQVHAGGWVHGNLRPGQVAMRDDGTPVLLDSGAVELTLSNRLPKPREWPQSEFLPVELLESSSTLPVGPWSDLYSLAALVVWARTGQVPGEDSDWQRLAASCGGLRPALEAALHPEPARRPQNVAEFREAMEARHAKGARESRESVDAAAVASVKDLLIHVTGHPSAGAAGKRPVAGLAPLHESREPAWSSLAEPAPRREEAVADDAVDDWYAVPPAKRAARMPFGLARPARHWPWALGGAAVGAVVSAVLTLFVLRPTTELHWSPGASLGTLAGTPAVRGPGEATPAVAPALPPTAQLGAAAPRAPAPGPVPHVAAAGPTAADPAALIATTPSAAGVPPVSAATAGAVPAAPVVAAPVAGTATAPSVAGQTNVVAAVPTPSPGVAESLLEKAADTVAAAARTRSEPVHAAAAERGAPGDARDAVAAARREESALAENPAAACSPRTNFALYRCMQNQCEQRRFFTHPQCIRLRVRDEVS
jgi:non-specific serine/threonine protein kinase